MINYTALDMSIKYGVIAIIANIVFAGLIMFLSSIIFELRLRPRVRIRILFVMNILLSITTFFMRLCGIFLVIVVILRLFRGLGILL